MKFHGGTENVDKVLYKNLHESTPPSILVLTFAKNTEQGKGKRDYMGEKSAHSTTFAGHAPQAQNKAKASVIT